MTFESGDIRSFTQTEIKSILSLKITDAIDDKSSIANGGEGVGLHVLDTCISTRILSILNFL